MNNKKILLASVIILIAVGGIIAFQLYWIKNAVSIKQEKFDESVNDALHNVAAVIEKKAISAKVTRRLNMQRQSEPENHLNDKNIIFKKRDKLKDMRLNVFEEIITDSAGFLTKKQSSKTYKSNALNHPDFKIDVDLKKKDAFVVNTGEGNNRSVNWFLNQGNMLNDIFDEQVSINIYNDYSNKIDTVFLDSVLQSELKTKGIYAKYEYGILNQYQNGFVFPVKAKLITNLLNSSYKINLTAQNIFIDSRYLSLYFPGQKNYIIRNLMIMLLGSAFLILLILIMFSYTIVTIFRQKQLSQIKNDFINNMTHEFKTPISTISLACEVLGDPTIEKNQQKINNYVKVIKDENKRLGMLVENVLQTAVLEKGKLNLKLKPIDIHEIIESVLNNSYVQIENKKAEIEIDFDARESVINADKVHISNIIYNLLDNALKYSGELPKVKISTKSDNKGLYLYVKDNGIGIGREDLQRVFEKLYRVPTGNIHNVKGFGLGLSYVKAIVEKHGGNIFVESTLGVGSTFTCFFPFAQREQTNNN
ncbi:MAG: HAMP domain-containing histidine kinase [Bacteroidia bacterium]|nr:HAMP domain-containing histidine kinase [Bacteroidia bacterium]